MLLRTAPIFPPYFPIPSPTKLMPSLPPITFRSTDMVVALGPAKFYGSSLPRPRFYTDVKLNDSRVDPPPPVMDPLMSWSQEAHWSMGGVSYKRHRLQGRIEGNVEKLRAQREQISDRSPIQKKSTTKLDASPREDEVRSEIDRTPSPPPAPVAMKRRRVLGLADEEEVEVLKKSGIVRRLGDDFERVARESGMVANADGESGASPTARTRSKSSKANVSSDGEGIKKGKKKLVKVGGKIGAAVVVAAARVRSSPRFSERR